MTDLRAHNVSFSYSRDPILRGVSVDIEPGTITGIVGPNGCGKSTLLRLLGGLRKPSDGKVTLDGRAIGSFRPRERARLLGFLPQSPAPPPGVRVRELVALGRAPHLAPLARPTARDRSVIDESLEVCDAHTLGDRVVSSLSGGERQRAWLAMTLAQQPRVLLLDEPTSALDIGHQLSTLALVRQLTRERDLAVGIVLHDLDLAIQSCDRLCALKDGVIRASGEASDVLTPDVCNDLFGVRPDPTSGHTPRCRFSLPAHTD